MDTMEVPLVFNLDTLVQWFVTHPEKATRDNVEEALSRLDRNEGPAMLYDLQMAGVLPREVFAGLLGYVWNAAEWPEQNIDPFQWVEFFEYAGYRVDGVPTSKPADSIRLYRGATEERRLGMAWTTSLEVAQRFASGTMTLRRQPGKVWTAMVAPCALLAELTDRDEHEYVVDPDWLDWTSDCGWGITEYQGSN